MAKIHCGSKHMTLGLFIIPDTAKRLAFVPRKNLQCPCFIISFSLPSHACMSHFILSNSYPLNSLLIKRRVISLPTPSHSWTPISSSSYASSESGLPATEHLVSLASGMGSLAEQCLLDVKSHDNQLDQTGNLEEFLSRLEEERLKIEVFKCELPLCMQLLNNALEAYRKQLESYQEQRPTLQLEFIPLRKTISSDGESPLTGNLEKSRWREQSKDVVDNATSPLRLAVDDKQTNGGAFITFSKDKPLNGNLSDPFLTNSKQCEAKKCLDTRRIRTTDDHIVTNSKINDSSMGMVNISTPKEVKTGLEGQATVVGNHSSGTHRKARRCWTPELHKIFVDALHMLGGSQVATPKQIRELMKVDGLTIDEIKSHLQKYRLHTRKPIPMRQTAALLPQLVVLSSLCVPPGYAADATVYGAHTSAGVTHYCTSSPISRDFYSPPASPHLHLPQRYYHQASTPVVAAQFNRKSATNSCSSGLRNGNSLVPNVKNNGGEGLESMENGEEDGVVAIEEEEKGKLGNGGWRQGEDKAMVSFKADDGEATLNI